METTKFQNWLNSYSVKMVLVSALALFLLIPTIWIQNIINERIKLKKVVEEQLSQQWGQRQVVSGPVMNIPYTYYQAKENDEGFIERKAIAHFLPEELKIICDITSEIRYRGIYKMPVYENKIKVTGSFSKPDFSKVDFNCQKILWNEAYFTMGISDLRGIKDSVPVLINGEICSLEPGIPEFDLFQSGITITNNSELTDSTQSFQIELTLNGSTQFSVEAIGKTTTVNMHSSWTNPSFTGSFLPVKREVNNDGFSAKWVVTHLNRNFPQQWTGKKHKTSDTQLGVQLLLPVDHYQKSIRSVKYAILFIALNFIVILFIEIRNKKRIHPFQYSLVAFALLLFYTLLTSIGEQLGFNIAFGISALAISTLISWYSFNILKDKKQVAWITILQIGLYLFLFTILQLQDYALLMGSIGLFVILGLIMKASQKIKWHNDQQE